MPEGLITQYVLRKENSFFLGTLERVQLRQQSKSIQLFLICLLGGSTQRIDLVEHKYFFSIVRILKKFRHISPKEIVVYLSTLFELR